MIAQLPRAMPPDIQVVPETADLFRVAADLFVCAARRAVTDNGRFAVALAGGSTPRGLYTLLAERHSSTDAMPWDKSHFFWTDERHVAPSHAESNFRMAMETMLSRLPVPAAHVHRIKAELADAAQAAENYEHALQAFFGLAESEFPRFDLVLLGLGGDAHTASLFPGTQALEVSRRRVVSNRVEQLGSERITLTAPAINSAAHVVFLVSGAQKARALAAVLEGEYDPTQLPAQLIGPAWGRLTLIADAPAAAGLSRIHLHSGEDVKCQQ